MTSLHNLKRLAYYKLKDMILITSRIISAYVKLKLRYFYTLKLMFTVLAVCLY